MKTNVKKALRIVCCALVFCMLTAVFVGCGKKENTPETKPETSPETSVDSGSETNKEPNSEPVSEPEYDPTVDEDPEPLTLNIGSYNIANGSKVNHNMMLLAKDIVDQGLDIVGLQEVDQFCDRSGNMDTMKTLSDLTGMPYYTFFKSINLGSGEYGIGVLSKYPILEDERIALYSTGEERVLGRTKIDVNGREINFFTTHLEWEPNATRYKELEQMNEILGQYDNFVVVGDFNVHELSEYRKLTYKGMVNTEEKPILTYSSYDGDWYLDNIIYSPDDWTFGEGKTLPNGHSDHFLLYATGTFAPKGRNSLKDSEGKELPALSDGKKSTAENIGKWAEGTDGAYVTMDLGLDYNIASVNVINAKTCDSIYKWAVYGTDDAALSIEQWTKIAEKTSDEKATGAGYTALVSEENAKLPIRYIRIYATYHSGDANYQIAEVAVQGTAHKEDKTDLTSMTAITNQAGKKFASLKDGVTDRYVRVGKVSENCYVEIDIGQAAFLHSLKVYQPVGDGDRVYKWVAYAAADNTLPIEQWTTIGEKSGDEVSGSEGYLLKIAKELKETEFQYIRIYGTSYNLNDNFDLNEVTVYGTTAASLRNLMKDAAVKAGNGGNCDAIKDGNTGGYFDLGYWCDSDENKANGIPVGTAGTCYVEIDLGKLCKIDFINVVNYISTSRIYKWTAYVTTDNTKPIDEWTDIGGKTTEETSSDMGYTHALTKDQQNTPVRYIRIYGMYHNSNWGYHINEVTVSGVAAE